MLIHLFKTTGKYLFWIFIILFVSSCIKHKTALLSLSVSNNIDHKLSDVVIELNNRDIIEQLNKLDTAKIAVTYENKELPYQLIKSSSTGLVKSMLILSNFNAQEQQIINISEKKDCTQDFTKRTQAEISIKKGGKWIKIVDEGGVVKYKYQGGQFHNVDCLRVPDKQTDNSSFIRYEGPGWESDKIAYRFYLDWRNAVDIFGKTIPEMVLQNVGQDGFPSYHELSPWGMDVLKVGNSLGLGSIGFWDGQNAARIAITDSIFCKISQNGAIRSTISTNYYGWKDSGISLNLESTISIDAGSRLTHENIRLSTMINNICTGIVKHDSAQMFQSEIEKGDWAYLATFGNQSLNGDKLGMFVFYNKSKIVKVTEDSYSYVIILLPENKKIDYYFGAVWEKDMDKISTREQFETYLNTTLTRLNAPINIKN